MRAESGFSLSSFQNADTAFQPVYAWIWNDKIESDEIRRRLDGMRRAGIRTVYVLPEPKNFRPERIRTFLEPDYLTDDFMRLVREAAEYALSLGMNVWMYDEGGWPSGGACGRTVETHPRMLRKALVPRDETLPAGQAYAPGANDVAAFTMENGALRRVKSGEGFPEARALTVYGVQLGEGWTTDSLQDGIGKAFVEETHERYTRFLGDILGRIPFMFTDEPGTGRFPWPDGFAEKFLARFGYDLRDHLPALFNLEEDVSGADARAREDYRALQGELFRDNYMRPIHDWCRRNGVRSTGHLDIDHLTDGCMAHGYGTVLQQLREFDVPGVDVIWRQIDFPRDGKPACYEGNGFFERFASSAAAQTGGTLAVTESFGVYGASLTGELARFVILHQLVRGINVFNFMCMSYTPHNALSLVERPEWVEEMPGFFHLRGLNDFTARASWLMQLGKPAARTALYFPARDIWAGGTRAKNAIARFEQLGQALERAQIDFDILDEEGLRMASRDGNALTLGLARYETVLVPDGATLPDALRETLQNVDAPAKPVLLCDGPTLRARARELPGGETLVLVFNESDQPLRANVQFPHAGASATGDDVAARASSEATCTNRAFPQTGASATGSAATACASNEATCANRAFPQADVSATGDDAQTLCARLRFPQAGVPATGGDAAARASNEATCANRAFPKADASATGGDATACASNEATCANRAFPQADASATGSDAQTLCASLRFPQAGVPVRLDPATGRAFRVEDGIQTFAPGEGKFFLFTKNGLSEAEAEPKCVLWRGEIDSFTLTVAREALIGADGVTARAGDGTALNAAPGSWEPLVGTDFSGECVYRARVTLPDEAAPSASDGRAHVEPDGQSAQAASPAGTDFSGECACRARVTLPDGLAPRAGQRWRLSLGRVERTARVRINGRDAGIAWVEPKAVEFDGALFGDSQTAEIEIEVANTIANRIRAAKLETLFDPRVLGPYHARQIVFEQEAAEGGLYGPVALERLD